MDVKELRIRRIKQVLSSFEFYQPHGRVFVVLLRTQFLIVFNSALLVHCGNWLSIVCEYTVVVLSVSHFFHSC